jgi:glutamyl-tRNA reductase
VDAGLQARLACVPQVEKIVAEEAAEFNAWLATREVIPTLKDLRDKIETLVNREFQAALGKLDHLDDKDKAVLHRMAHRLVNTMLHEPTTGLKKQAAGQQGSDYAALVRELFALDTAREAS